MFTPESNGGVCSAHHKMAVGQIVSPALVLLLLVFSTNTAATGKSEGPKLGRPATGEEIAAWDMSVFPNGKGLPPGRGTAVEGKTVYDNQCAGCHGPRGTGGSGGELAGGQHGLTEPHPDKTIGTYWPYATTIFDFVRRSMPLDAPGSLNDNQVYAVTAYLLYLNSIIGEKVEINATTLPQIKMPNREGFVWIDVPQERK